jgi:hypothetical protein
MKFIAAIRKAPFALDREYDDLCRELITKHSITEIKKIYSLSELEFISKYSPESRIIWFENSAVRFDVNYVIEALKVAGVEVVQGHKDPNFGQASHTPQLLGFKASAVSRHGGVLTYLYHHKFSLPMTAIEDHRKYQIVLVAHQRPEYPKLTLASLFNAFSAYPNKRVSLYINEDNGKFDAIIQQYEHRDDFNVIRSGHNFGFSTLYKLYERNIIEDGVYFYFEDDFVLPFDIETRHPLWAREFYDMAAQGGYAGWRAAIYPTECHLPTFNGDFTSASLEVDKRWVFNYGSRRLLTGYAFASHTDVIKKASRLTTKITDEVANCRSSPAKQPRLANLGESLLPTLRPSG